MILNNLMVDARRSKQDESLISDSDFHAAGNMHCKCRLCMKRKASQHSGGPPRAMTSSIKGKTLSKISNSIPAQNVSCDFDDRHRGCDLYRADSTATSILWLCCSHKFHRGGVHGPPI
jgi:hypothetical protein